MSKSYASDEGDGGGAAAASAAAAPTDGSVTLTIRTREKKTIERMIEQYPDFYKPYRPKTKRGIKRLSSSSESSISSSSSKSPRSSNSSPRTFDKSPQTFLSSELQEPPEMVVHKTNAKKPIPLKPIPLKPIPLKSEDLLLIPECGDGECENIAYGNCRSTNYLEPIVAISCSYQLFNVEQCIDKFREIYKDAKIKINKKSKYEYENAGVTICFSNAQRAINHYKNLLVNIKKKTKDELDIFLKKFKKVLKNKYTGLPTIKSCYIGYVPTELLVNDPNNQKHQLFSDVYFLTIDNMCFGVSCKAQSNCPLTNWWFNNYLLNSGILNSGMKIVQEDFEKLIEKRISDDGEKDKKTMREKWNREDKKIRINNREPVFAEGSIMKFIQGVFKNEDYGKTLAQNIVSDIFAQTSSIDMFLAVAGTHSGCLVLTDYAPNINNIELDFKINKATSGDPSKFIFGMKIEFRNSSDEFYTRVEIRRSGRPDDYRIHVVLEDIKTQSDRDDASETFSLSNLFSPKGGKSTRKKKN